MQAESVMRRGLWRLPPRWSSLRSHHSEAAIRRRAGSSSNSLAVSCASSPLANPPQHSASLLLLCNQHNGTDMPKRRFSSFKHGLFGYKVEPPRRVTEEQLKVLKNMVNEPSKDPARVQEAYDLVRLMMQEFIFPTMHGMDASLMVMTADALDDADFVIEVYTSLGDGNVSPSPSTLELTSKACAKTGNWQLASEIVERMLETATDSYEMNPLVYENAILACHRSMKWMKAMRFLEAMNERNLPCRSEVYLKALETCIRAEEDNATAKVLFMYFKEFPVLDDVEKAQETLMHCLKVALDTEDVEHVMMFHKVLEELEMPPLQKDQMTKMIDLCVRQQEWKTARKMVYLYTGQNDKPIAEDLDSARFADQVIEVFDEIERLEIPLSLEGYNSVLRVCGRHLYKEKAAQILAKLKQGNVASNAVSYAAVMRANSSHSLQKVQELYEELVTSNIEPTNDVLHAYMQTCSKHKEFEHMVQFYENNQLDAIDQIQEDPRILSLIATAYGRTERLDKLLKIFAHMRKHDMNPTIHVYTQMVFAYCKLGQWERALMMWNHIESLEFTEEQLAVNPLLWEAAVLACSHGIDHCKANNLPTYEYVSQLVDIYEQMIELNVQVTSNTVSMLFSRLMLVSAMNLWQFFMKRTQLHDPEFVDRNHSMAGLALWRACEENDRELVERVASDAKRTLQLPDNANRLSLILGFFAKRKEVGQFVDWCKQTKASGVQLNPHIYGAALCYLAHRYVESIPDHAVAMDAINDLLELQKDPQSCSPLEMAQQVVAQAIANGFGDHTYLMMRFVGMCHSHEDAKLFLDLLQANDMTYPFCSDLLYNTVRVLASHPQRHQLCSRLLCKVLSDSHHHPGFDENSIGALEAFREFFQGESQWLVEIVRELDNTKPLNASTLEQLLLSCAEDKSLEALEAMCEQIRRWPSPELTLSACEFLENQLQQHQSDQNAPLAMDLEVSNIQALYQEGLPAAGEGKRPSRAGAKWRSRRKDYEQMPFEALGHDESSWNS